MNKGASNFLSVSNGCGRKHALSPEVGLLLDRFVSAMLNARIIAPVKH